MMMMRRRRQNDNNNDGNILVIIMILSILWTLVRKCDGFAPTTTTTTNTMRRTSDNRIGKQLHQLNMIEQFSIVDQVCVTYNTCLETNPWVTQSCTAGIFAGLGDTLAQKLDENDENNSSDRIQKREYNPTRTFHYVLKGLGGGIMWAAWYQILDPLSLDITNIVFDNNSKMDSELDSIQAMFRVGLSILLEQFICCPIFYTLWDIPVPALLSGSPLRQMPDQISNKLGPLLIANAKLWTPVNFITYNLPLEYRVLFISCVDVIWQAMLSQITSKEIIIVVPNNNNNNNNEPVTTTTEVPKVTITTTRKLATVTETVKSSNSKVTSSSST